VSLKERVGQHKHAIIGLSVVAVSLFGAIAPAAAASLPSIKLTSSTPSFGVGGVAKLKAVVKPVAPVTLTPSGNVTFKEGATTVGTANLSLVNTVMTAKLDVPGLAIGNHTFTATYNGDGNFTPNTSLPLTIVVTTVAKIDTTTTTTTSTPNVAPGQDVKLKAVVKQASGTNKPTGDVRFSEGATTYATVPLSLTGTTVETAKYTIIGGLSQGTHVITATYLGSQAFNGSNSTATVIVGKINTTCSLVANASTTEAGKTMLVLTVRPAAGVIESVNFFVDGSGAQPNNLSATGRSQYNVVFLVGTTHTARAVYAGDATYNGCTSATVNFTSMPLP
jgi:hypothetical protein